nr:uncharacterized mitochondrial protein AtMg00820-like [Tanacetum cinerariifolium]
MGKTIGELHALLIEYEKDLPKKAITPQVMAIQGGRIQKANKKSYNAKGKDPESNKWLDAMNAKMQSMKDNQVWRLVDLPPNDKTIGSKWLFKKKTDMDGN